MRHAVNVNAPPSSSSQAVYASGRASFDSSVFDKTIVSLQDKFHHALQRTFCAIAFSRSRSSFFRFRSCLASRFSFASSSFACFIALSFALTISCFCLCSSRADHLVGRTSPAMFEVGLARWGLALNFARCGAVNDAASSMAVETYRQTAVASLGEIV